MLSDNEVIKRIEKSKKQIQPYVAEGMIFYDDLCDILKITIDGDKVAGAINKVFDIEKVMAYETSINGIWAEYGIILINEELFEYKDDLIKEHYMNK